MGAKNEAEVGMRMNYGWLLSCLLVAGCGGGFDTDPGLQPLAKAEGWRDHLEATYSYSPSAIVEVAYDRETAELAWRENVPDELEIGSAPGPGRFGDLDMVDFEREVVIVWASGESGSCPGWLADLRGDASGRVFVETDSSKSWLSDACTADYRPYRMVYAVARERVPPSDALPIDGFDGDRDGLVDLYPAEVEPGR